LKLPEKNMTSAVIKIPKKIKLDEDILKLFGYFLAEGSISEGKCNNYLLFALNIKEADIVEDIKRTANKFGLAAVVREIPKGKPQRSRFTARF